MKTLVVYLKPTAPFHLQTGGEDHESIEPYPQADTLSSAISYWWFRQFNEIPGFPESLPYRFSSLFPAVMQDDDYQKLYPKPADLTIEPEKHNHKVFKKIKWVDETLFEKWRAGDNLPEHIPEDAESSSIQRGGSVWISRKAEPIGKNPLVTVNARTRVTLDRVNSASTPFHFVNAHYANDVRLWCYLDVDPEHEKTVLALLRLLGDEGLGADRTVGMGSFKVETVKEAHPKSEKDNRWVNLGIYNPAENEVEEINWMESIYDLSERGGWVSGKSVRRSPLTCISGNAILKTSKKPIGRIPCVIDKDDDNLPDEVELDYSVYRDCRGYFV